MAQERDWMNFRNSVGGDENKADRTPRLIFKPWAERDRRE